MKLEHFPYADLRTGENVRQHLGDCLELAVSIATQGLQQPIVVRLLEPRAAPELAPRAPLAGSGLVPVIVQGHRRHKAIGLLFDPPDELRELCVDANLWASSFNTLRLGVPCRIFEGDERAAWLSQFSDTTGQKLSIYELGSRSIALRERSVSRAEIARALGKSDRYVENCEAIVLGVCPEIRRALERNAEGRDFRFTFDRLKRWSRLPEEQQRKEFFELCPPPTDEQTESKSKRQRGPRTRLDKEHAKTLLLQATALQESGAEGWARVVAVLRHLLEGTPSPLPMRSRGRRSTALMPGESSSARESATSSARSAITSTDRSASPPPPSNGRLPPSS